MLIKSTGNVYGYLVEIKGYYLVINSFNFIIIIINNIIKERCGKL